MTRHIPLLVLLLLLALVVPVGADTYLFSNSVSGYTAGLISTGGSLQDILATGGTDSSTNVSTAGYAYLRTSNDADVGEYDLIRRAHEHVDTSSLPDDFIVTSSTVSLYIYISGNGLGTPVFGITDIDPAYDTSVQYRDHIRYVNTLFSDSYKTYTVAGWYNLTGNQALNENISKIGYTNYIVRLKQDITQDITGLTWKPYRNYTYIGYYSRTGTTPPVFTVVGSSPSVAAFTNNTAYPLSGPAPLTVQFEDLSTNTPTAWNWSWSNSTGIWHLFNTSQNGTGVFSIGPYSVNLTVCNVAGCDEEVKTDYVTVIATAAPTVCYYMNMTNATVQNATWTANVADGWVGIEANASNSTAFWYHCVTPATTATTPPPTQIPNLPAQPPVDWNVLQWWWIPAALLIIWLVKK